MYEVLLTNRGLVGIAGWVDDSCVGGRDYWAGGAVGGAYPPQSSTTGRRGRLPPPPTRAKPKTSHTLKVGIIMLISW